MPRTQTIDRYHGKPVRQLIIKLRSLYPQMLWSLAMLGQEYGKYKSPECISFGFYKISMVGLVLFDYLRF